MLAEKLDFRHWVNQFSFNAHNLKFVGRDPSASLQFDRVNLDSYFVAMNSAGAVVALLEANQPGGLSAPVSQALTFHVEVVAHVGMKNQRQRSKPGAGNLVGIAG